MMNDQKWEQKFAELARASGMDTLPQERRDQLMTAFNQYSRTRPTLLQRLIGNLSIDSFAQPLPQGARDSNLGETRQLFYLCDLGDIALDIASQGDDIVLSGQLFFNKANSDSFTVTVKQQDVVVGSALTKSRNNFRLQIPAGLADLTFTNHTYTLSLKNVPLELVRG